MGFKKVLIANRGEIALRIMRTLRDMGIEAAIIYGKEDRLSLPVQLADDATFRDVINPLDAYLDIEAVVQAAKDMGCDAVHPGYGFLAENAGFVKRLEEEGITFIGPSADVITLLGIKSKRGLPWKPQACQQRKAPLNLFLRHPLHQP